MPHLRLLRLRPRRSPPWLLLTCLALALSGCGYTHQPLYDSDIHTVAVVLFENPTQYHGLEREVTEALEKQIELRTPYKCVAREHADTVIEGKILAVSESLLSRTPRGGLPQEVETHVVFNFTWKNLRTGKTLRERKGISAVGRFIPAHPVSETIEVSQHEAANIIATELVSIMRKDW